MFEIPADLELQDDLEVAHNPDEYRDAPLPTPVLAGDYAVRIVKSGLKRDYEDETKIVLVKNDAGEPQYPIIVINELEIVKPEEFDGRKVFPMGFGQEFGTKPYMDRDFNTGETFPANNIAKILRSHDASLSFRGTNEGLKLVQRLSNEGSVFHVRIDWVAEDREYIKAQIDALKAALNDGAIDEETFKSKAREVRYKQGRLEGMNKFVQDGQLVPSWVGPSGNEVEARAFIRKFLSTAQQIKLGVKKVKGSGSASTN
jgi:hypothetical protein